MRCNCESTECQLHEVAACAETAYVRSIWIGGICLDCAVGYPRSYLIPVGESEPLREERAI